MLSSTSSLCPSLDLVLDLLPCFLPSQGPLRAIERHERSKFAGTWRWRMLLLEPVFEVLPELIV